MGGGGVRGGSKVGWGRVGVVVQCRVGWDGIDDVLVCVIGCADSTMV